MSYSSYVGPYVALLAFRHGCVKEDMVEDRVSAFPLVCRYLPEIVEIGLREFLVRRIRIRVDWALNEFVWFLRGFVGRL